MDTTTARTTPGVELRATLPPPRPAPPPDPRCVATRLVWLVRYLRRTLETLECAEEVRKAHPYVHTNVHGLLRACDPETNPRLRKCLEDLDLSTRA